MKLEETVAEVVRRLELEQLKKLQESERYIEQFDDVTRAFRKLDPDIFVPSFNMEKMTKSFNRYIWFFVALISLAAIPLVLLLHASACHALGLDSSFVHRHMSLIMMLAIVPPVTLAYQGALFISSLLSSYKFKDGLIVRGHIQTPNKVRKKGRLEEAAADLFTLSAVFDTTSLKFWYLTNGLLKFAQRLKLNMNKAFVDAFFDTAVYRKTEYHDIKLLNETDYVLVYKSTEKKKIVIPKIYEGICYLMHSEKKPFLGRIIVRAVIVAGSAAALALFDIIVAVMK